MLNCFNELVKLLNKTNSFMAVFFSFFFSFFAGQAGGFVMLCKVAVRSEIEHNANNANQHKSTL